jgi:hypothetical protein
MPLLILRSNRLPPTYRLLSEVGVLTLDMTVDRILPGAQQILRQNERVDGLRRIRGITIPAPEEDRRCGSVHTAQLLTSTYFHFGLFRRRNRTAMKVPGSTWGSGGLPEKGRLSTCRGHCKIAVSISRDVNPQWPVADRL